MNPYFDNFKFQLLGLPDEEEQVQFSSVQVQGLILIWKLINVVYFHFSAQAELSKPSVAAAPLERKKGNTQHFLVSTSGLYFICTRIVVA